MASVRHSSTDENSEREYQTIDRLIEDNLFRELSEFVAIQTYRGGALSEDQVVNARFLVRGGEQEVPEGTARSRNVVIEFDSYQAALDCYHSSEYQSAKALRADAAESDLVIIQGYAGNQPGD